MSKVNNFKDRLQKSIESVRGVKEKIAIAMDTCCFASVDLDYDEFDKLTRDLEDVLECLNNLKDEVQ
jgi:hypothetical protein